MTAVSRIERPSMLGVSMLMNSNAGEYAAPPATGTNQQRHAARVDQQYALAQYTAQQQYFQTQQAAYPDGDFPPIRELVRETATPAANVQRQPPHAQPTNDELVAQARKILELHTTGVLSDAELVTMLDKLFAA